MDGDATAAIAPIMTALGLDGFVLLAAAAVGGELELLVETDEAVTGCPTCGLVATAHGRREHLVRDVPLAGLPVTIMWAKRVWRCADADCPKKTWSERHPGIAPKASLTERAAEWILDQVGRAGRTVAAVRRELAVGGWHTVMRRVQKRGAPLVDDPARLAGVTGLGVDETVVLHAGAYAVRPRYATADGRGAAPIVGAAAGHRRRGYQPRPATQVAGRAARANRRGADRLAART